MHSASLAQLVNVIAPIMTEPGGRLWRQTTFHPFALTAQHAKGDVLRLAVESPQVETVKFGEVNALDAVATRDAETGEVAIFAVNRSVSELLTLTVDIRSLGDLRLLGAQTLSNPDHTWAATAGDDTSVLPRDNSSAAVSGGTVTVELPAVSWSVIRLGA